MKKLIKFLQQIFCNHIWKDGSTIFLRREKERYGESDENFEVLSEYSATQQKCIKCEKEKYLEKKKMILTKK